VAISDISTADIARTERLHIRYSLPGPFSGCFVSLWMRLSELLGGPTNISVFYSATASTPGEAQLREGIERPAKLTRDYISCGKTPPAARTLFCFVFLLSLRQF